MTTTRLPYPTPLSAGALESLALELAEGPALHVFRVASPAGHAAAALEAMLSIDERERARRFHFDRDRHTYLVARAALRRLLAAYSGAQPEALRFAYNEFGKPALVSAAQLHFNVSHSDGVAAIAVCRTGRIGIDVERVVRERAALDAAQLYFAASERLALKACAIDSRHELFFMLWTLKEAYVKAMDRGLSIALDSFEFEVADDESVIRFRNAMGEREADWQFSTRTVFADYRCSVALQRPAAAPRALRVFEYR